MTTLLAPPPARAPAVPPGVPRLSVVIAAYQAAGTIADTLDSLLDQTRAAYEIVVCDDGSTDDLAVVLARYGDAVRLLRQPNRGFAAARNTAIWNTTGDAVAFVDADDTVEPRYVEALTDAMAERPDLEMIAGDMLFERGGEVIGRKERSSIRSPSATRSSSSSSGATSGSRRSGASGSSPSAASTSRCASRPTGTCGCASCSAARPSGSWTSRSCATGSSREASATPARRRCASASCCSRRPSATRG